MSDDDLYLIEYDSLSTVNGKIVGLVYVVNTGHISPRTWSYTKDPNEATSFASYDEAQQEARKHRWHKWAVVPLRHAPVL